MCKESFSWFNWVYGLSLFYFFDDTKMMSSNDSRISTFVFFKHLYHKLFLRKFLLIILMTITIQSGYCQTSQSRKKIDSLKNLLTVKSGSEKFDVIYELLRENLGRDLVYAFELANAAEKVAIELNDSVRIVKAKLARGVIYTRRDLVNESIVELNEALKISDRNNFENETAKILNFFAIDYSYVGNYDKSLECHFRSLQLNEAKQNKEEIGITYNNIGFVHFKLKDYETAIKYYLKSLDIKKSIHSDFDLDRLLINLALCYNQVANYSEAEKSIREGLAVCKSNCNPEIKMEANLGLGISLLHRGKYLEALDFFQASLAISKEIGQKRFQIENLISISDIKFNEGLDDDAIKLLQEAERIGNSTQYSYSLIEVYRRLSKVYNKLNNFQLSSEYKEKYISLKDSIYSEDLIKNLAKVQTNYAERENIKTIKEKDQIIELRQALIKRQQAQYIFIVAITLLVLGLGLVLLIANKRQQRASAELAGAKVKIEEQNVLLAEQNKILDNRVKERTVELSKSNKLLTEVNSELDNFLYKTSHDIRGPLVTLKGLCNLALIEAKESSLRDILTKLDDQSDKMAKILNRLTAVGKVNQSNLTPVKINFKGILDGVLKSEEVNSLPKNVKVTYEIANNVSMISDAELVTNILENLIDNSIKFYNNSSRVNPFVHVAIAQESSYVMVKVEDNGIGILNAAPEDVFHMFMRASERSDTGGVGLYLSKICTDKLGGEIKLAQTSKDGSTFVIQFPIDLSPIIAQRKLQEEEMKRQREREVAVNS